MDLPKTESKKIIPAVPKSQTKQPKKSPAKDVVKSPAKEIVKAPVKQTVKTPAKEVKKSPTKNNIFNKYDPLINEAKTVPLIPDSIKKERSPYQSSKRTIEKTPKKPVNESKTITVRPKIEKVSTQKPTIPMSHRPEKSPAREQKPLNAVKPPTKAFFNDKAEKRPAISSVDRVKSYSKLKLPENPEKRHQSVVATDRRNNKI